MRPAFTLCALCFLLADAAARAATLNVPGSFATIQAAIDAAAPGDVVAVAPGIYLESLSIRAPQDGISLQGTLGASETVVDAGGAGVPLTASGVGSSTTIVGLTFRDGSTPNPGGGLLFTSASPSLLGCVIEENSAAAGGGAYIDQGSSPSFSGCIFRNNHAPHGSGGGIYGDHGGSPSLSYCQVYANTSAAYGGGVTSWVGAIITLDHCTVAGNGAALAGGNAYCTRAGSVVATHCVFAFPTQNSNVEATSTAGSSTFACCDMFVSSGPNVVGLSSPVGSNGNFSLDPQFCDFAGWNLGLMQSSPCASATNASCHLVGALDAQCSPVPVARASWGSLKAHYR